VAGPVIQATGRSEFEDLRIWGRVTSGVVSHREELIQCIALHMHCGVLAVFNTILYENEFQNPHILMDTLETT
jgi:hypothetical protein